MKMETRVTVTKYPQSCLTIVKDGRCLLVDPGTLAMADHRVKDFGKFDAVLYTHSHADHLDVAIIDELAATGATLYGNSDVAKVVGHNQIEVIEDGEELVVAGFKIKAYHMEHCLMVDGSKGVPNTGFMLDDHFLLPGDSVEDVGVKAEAIALPVFGPDISLHDSYRLLVATKAKTVIPVHYDIAHLNPGVFEMLGGKYHPSIQIKTIKNGESVEV
jgi:L-ascorbate metabolism protein UlaG (beta-lactamase superfamily)